jgi:BirA family transcriptional regulator, biotin operon repressor / biotin---[acetyl-CoA-carboxylase] ligase
LTRRVQQAGTDPTDLAALGVARCDRNRLAAALLNEIVGGLVEFEREGLAAFAAEWSAADALSGRSVEVTLPGSHCVGQACGIDSEGALCVRIEGAVRHFHSGEVSVRSK